MSTLMFMKDESFCLDESSLTHVSVLGKGGFGYVSLKRDPHFRLYAKKTSPLSHFAALSKELRIMLRFRNHPRVVQPSSSDFYFGTNPNRCYIYMEFAPKGTLHRVIGEFRGRSVPEFMIGKAALMILQGLEAFHSRGYVHCDIKPGNILVFPSKAVGEPWELKLADFGLSKEPSTDQSSSLLGGTKKYMPPEVCGPKRVITPAVDIWSLGCVVIEMFGGRPEKIGDVYMWRLPKTVSPMVNDFLKRCLALEPSRRAKAEELLKHPFVSQRINVQPAMPLCIPFSKFPCAMRNNVVEGGSIHDGINALKI